MQLTQKERMYLQDAKSQEELCIAKYNHYSSIVQSPQLKQILQWAGQQETHHHQTISDLLQGRTPQMGGSGQTTTVNQIISQFATGASMSAGTRGRTSGGQQTQGQSMMASNTQFTGQGGLSDQQICQDLLSTEKAVSDMYDHAVFEASSLPLRQAFNHIQKEEQEHAFALFKYMEQMGWYQPQ